MVSKVVPFIKNFLESLVADMVNSIKQVTESFKDLVGSGRKIAELQFEAVWGAPICVLTSFISKKIIPGIPL